MRFGKAVAVAATVLLALVVGAMPASADTVTIRKVDTTGFPRVTVVAQVASTPAPTLDQFSLREDGRLVNSPTVVPLGETDTPVGVVLVIDTSGSMRDKLKIEAARAAAKEFVARKRPNDQIAVVAFSAAPRVVINFTGDANLLNGALDGLVATGETALWDAVRMGSGLLTERTDLQGNLVLLSDGADTTSVSPADDARAAALAANASVYAIGLRGGTEFDAGGLSALASATGGQYVEESDPTKLGAVYRGVQSAIQQQYEISYDSRAESVVNVTVTVAGTSASASAPIGATSRGQATTQPEAVGDSPFPSFLQGAIGQILIVLMALLAAGLLAYGLLLVIIRADDSTLRSALQPYSDEPGTGGQREETSLAESALIRRAVATTGRIARERGVLDALEKKLEQADLPLRPAEALFFSLVFGLLVIVIAAVLGQWAGLIVAVFAVGLLPIGTLNFMAAQRRRKFASQLPDMLQLLAGSLRAGYSLLQGVDAVAQEVSDPMGQELRRVLAEARLGRPLEDALEDAAERMASADFSWAVMAVNIQREVGGNLAELLDTVAETMIQRERLRREVRALTAEGRVSAIILGLLPVGLAMVMFASNREYISRLFSGMGLALLAGSGVLALFGFIWMKKIVDIEI